MATFYQLVPLLCHQTWRPRRFDGFPFLSTAEEFSCPFFPLQINLKLVAEAEMVLPQIQTE